MDPPPPGDVGRNAALRQLPKVDEVLNRPKVRGLLERAPRWAVLKAVRDEIERLRARLLAQPQAAAPVDVDETAVENDALALLRPSLVRVLNATGVVLHTNLGRA